MLGGAIGDAQLVKLKDDGSGVFKPHTQYKGSEKMQKINRERAAYLIDRFLGFDFVRGRACSFESSFPSPCNSIPAVSSGKPSSTSSALESADFGLSAVTERLSD